MIREKLKDYKKFVAVIQRYMKKHGVDAETACEELEEDYEEYKEACRLISTEE